MYTLNSFRNIAQHGAPGPIGDAWIPRLTNMQRNVASLASASEVLELCCGGVQSRSATALDLHHEGVNKFSVAVMAWAVLALGTL